MGAQSARKIQSVSCILVNLPTQDTHKAPNQITTCLRNVVKLLTTLAYCKIEPITGRSEWVMTKTNTRRTCTIMKNMWVFSASCEHALVFDEWIFPLFWAHKQSNTMWIEIWWRHKPAGLHTQREQWGVSCRVAGCEACIPSRTAGSLTSLESQKSLVDCNLLGSLEDTHN